MREATARVTAQRHGLGVLLRRSDRSRRRNGGHGNAVHCLPLPGLHLPVSLTELAHILSIAGSVSASSSGKRCSA